MYLLVIFVFAFFIIITSQEQIRQCLCTEMNQCKQVAIASLSNCIDECKVYFAPIGDPNLMKQCLLDQNEEVKKFRQCVMTNINMTGRCMVNANAPPKMIFKRKKTRILREIPDPLKQNSHKSIRNLSTIEAARMLLEIGKRFAICVRNCTHIKTEQCFDRANCSVELPPPTHINSILNKCGKQQQPIADTQVECNCFVLRAHVEQLREVCALMQTAVIEAIDQWHQQKMNNAQLTNADIDYF